MTSSFHLLSTASQGIASEADEAGHGRILGLGVFLQALALARIVYAGIAGEASGTETAIAYVVLIAASWMLALELSVVPPAATQPPKPRTRFARLHGSLSVVD